LLEINGNHATKTILLSCQRRELYKAHPAHKVHMKGWAQGIASITHSGNMTTAFTQDRIIHGYGEGFLLGQALLGPSAHLSKELCRIDPIARIESIVGSPIALQLAVGGQ
jgi:hypothetical protein